MSTPLAYKFFKPAKRYEMNPNTRAIWEAREEGISIPDVRYLKINNSAECFARFTEFAQCVTALGSEDADPCPKLKLMYQDVCPSDWTAKWTENLQNGIFVGLPPSGH